MRPGKNGLTLKVELLPELVSALQEAEAVARTAGLLSDDGEGDGEAEIIAASSS